MNDTIKDAIFFPSLRIWPEARGYLYDNAVTETRILYLPSGVIDARAGKREIDDAIEGGFNVTPFGAFKTKPAILNPSPPRS